MKHILGQALYQFVVMMIIVFAGDYFIPEFLTPTPELPAEAIWSPHSTNHIKYVRSGRLYTIGGTGNDYYNDYQKYGPSRHFTFVFNAFVIMQIFNFVSCRKINDEINIFSGLRKSKIFVILLALMIAGQIVIGNFGGTVFSVSLHGMDVRQWLIAVGFGFGSWVLNFFLKFIPNRIFMKVGNQKVDPLTQKSWVMGLKRSQTELGLQRKFSLSKKLKPTVSRLTRSQSFENLETMHTDRDPASRANIEIQLHK